MYSAVAEVTAILLKIRNHRHATVHSHCV